MNLLINGKGVILMKKVEKIILLFMLFAITNMLTITVEAKDHKISIKNKNPVISKNIGESIQKQRKEKWGYLREKDYYISKTINGNCIEESHEKEIEFNIDIDDLYESKMALFRDPFALKVNASSGDIGENESDKTGTVKCYSRIYYTKKSVNNRPFIRVTRITGSLKSLTGFSGSSQGSGISIIGNSVQAGECGIFESTRKFDRRTWSPHLENKPGSYGKDVNWPYVANDNGDTTEINATHTVTLKRGTSKWTLKLVNELI